MATITFTQDDFRGRNDNGTEATATWKAASNTNWNQQVGVPFRIRFKVHRANEGTSQNGSLDLWVSKNNGTFQSIETGASCPVEPVLSTTLDSHGTDTTQQLGSETYLVDNNGVNNSATAAETPTATWTNGIQQYAEAEYSLQIIASRVSIGDTLEFRCRFNTSVFTGGYTNVPILTVAAQQLGIAGGTVTFKGGTLTIK